jgi:pyruvate kinase
LGNKDKVKYKVRYQVMSMHMFNYPKTKIVCTIGPASSSFDALKQLIEAGMTIARLNFAHGSFEDHAAIVRHIRHAAHELQRNVAILLDLPGPKIRLGRLTQEPLIVHANDEICMSIEPTPPAPCLPIQINARTRNNQGNAADLFMKALKPDHIIYINDGMVQLAVRDVQPPLIHCKVLVGGVLMSHKGVNLPGVDMDISAITDRDREAIDFAAQHAVDAVSLSFVQNAKDIHELQGILTGLGYDPFIIAKIERMQAVADIEDILEKADGIMVARGDLGVETPIEEMAMVQKRLIAKANEAGKPVILATQMLESMLHNRRPTRAEATDVANAILDGADCVMLSEETAIGEYPVETVKMMTAIATATEKGFLMHAGAGTSACHSAYYSDGQARGIAPTTAVKDIISTSVKNAVAHLQVAVVMIPTQSGTTVRRISRLRLPVWLAAFTDSAQICRHLLFSWGAAPFYLKKLPENWPDYAQQLVKQHALKGEFMILVRGPAMLAFRERHEDEGGTGQHNSHADHETYRFEVIRLRS